MPLANAAEGALIELPAGPARHAQVLRLQPGAELTLFDGSGAQWLAQVEQMGRNHVSVRLGARSEVSRELPIDVTLALGVPTNERMDAVVEKATELGVAAIQPLLCERSVLRLSGERAERRREHWQAIAIAACEQCGRNRVPSVAPIETLSAWLGAPAFAAAAAASSVRWLLSTADAPALHAALRSGELSGGAIRDVTALSGPEGGLTGAEQELARIRGFEPVSLGPRVLRADTAPLALLAYLGLRG